ncbi:hypothetical protein Q5P01_007767 [Channa striata]|uniref:RNA helicase n=1 Tax=Channa striata TaxID=64152 RepID=A0AA88NCN5_CHASR|nr:hypothetical protein Q5P01_007767 [Channa striata]
MAIGCAMEGLECHVFIGGRPVSQDKLHLKKCHIAVGSPGRIKQLIELGMLSTASIRLFVLDEADKLLEEGSFQEQINWIFSSLPVNKQMLALSATYPESLAQFLTCYMREPTFVRLNPSDMGLKGLKQYYKLVQSHPLPHKIFEEKVQHLLELFSKIPFNQALVFSNLHTRAQHLADILSSKGLPAVCISGGLSQDQRLEAMSKLKQYQCRVLISTDLTSRGIDAEKVNLVINLDVPQDWETYMHRIGRAGRFGTQGLAVTYCCHGEEENKMMAIAQKCGLSLNPLPSIIEPDMMDEPCDWDVCTEASTPGPLSQVNLQKRKEETSQAEPTRKELQDALPKIPPLSSFKSRRSRFITFEEAEQDFQSFITTGLGRSVEVIRQFRGRDDNDPSDQNGHTESVTLDDDGAQSFTQNGQRSKCVISHPRLSSLSSSSRSDTEESRRDDETAGSSTECRARTEMKARHTPSLPKPQASPTTSKGFTSSAAKKEQTPCSSNGRTSSQPENSESAPNIRLSLETSQAAPAQTRRNDSKKLKEFPEKMMTERNRGRHKKEQNEEEMEQEEEEEEEEEWTAETYWKACYRAWNNYYASMSPFQEEGYQRYYSVAHNWLAAYRMNAVYMEELMKY